MNSRLNDRVRALRSFMSALQVIKAEIIFRSAPLPDILKEISAKQSGAAGIFFGKTYLSMQKGKDFWSSCQKWTPDLYSFGLTDSDIKLISDALYALGRYDSHSQAESINNSLIALDAANKEAKELCAQKGRLYRAMGVTAGIAIALIIV